MKYRTILMDPPWQETMVGKYKKTRHARADALPYPTLTVEQIRSLPVPDLADADAHLWLWTTNRSLPDGLDLMEAWGFKYLAPVHWIKPSGFGAWFVHRTQTLLFGCKGKLDMNERYKPNVLFANPGRHSQKPQTSYELIEAVSHGPYLELFARHRQNEKWSVWGNEVQPDIHIHDATTQIHH